jgi:uncharacterized protein DUF3800
VPGRYRLFVDESGDAQYRNSHENRYLGLTGIVIRLADHDGAMTDQLELLKQKHLPAHRHEAPLILHRQDIMRKTGPFSVLEDPDRAAAWERDILRFIRRLATRPITFVIDKFGTLVRYGTRDEDPYLRAMRYMLERYRAVLFYASGVGDVICEARGPKEDRRLREAYGRVYREGTEYRTAAEIQTVLTTAELKLARKEANIAGLQLADLIANPARQSLLQEHKDYPVSDGTTTARIIQIIRPKYHPANRRLFPPPRP